MRFAICKLLIALVCGPISAADIPCQSDQDEANVSCYASEARRFLRSWVTALDNRDEEAFLAHYAPMNSPRRDLTRLVWETRWRDLIDPGNPIEISLVLESLGIYDDDLIDITLWRTLASDQHHSREYLRVFLAFTSSGIRIEKVVALDEMTAQTTPSP